MADIKYDWNTKEHQNLFLVNLEKVFFRDNLGIYSSEAFYVIQYFTYLHLYLINTGYIFHNDSRPIFKIVE